MAALGVVEGVTAAGKLRTRRGAAGTGAVPATELGLGFLGRTRLDGTGEKTTEWWRGIGRGEQGGAAPWRGGAEGGGNGRRRQAAAAFLWGRENERIGKGDQREQGLREGPGRRLPGCRRRQERARAPAVPGGAAGGGWPEGGGRRSGGGGRACAGGRRGGRRRGRGAGVGQGSAEASSGGGDEDEPSSSRAGTAARGCWLWCGLGVCLLGAGEG